MPIQVSASEQVKGILEPWEKISISIQYNALVSPGKQLLKSDLFIIHTK